jgi:hypothetical protein
MKLLLGLLFTSLSLAAPLSPVAVHSDGHLLQTADGKPFFFLADTAWELIHSTTEQECSYYLSTRARQGFTVIQTVVLAEFDGLTRPTLQGHRPFIDNDPTRPVEAYFDRVVAIVDEAAKHGLYVALLPTWGDKLTAPWGAGPRIFTPENLPAVETYSRYLGTKLKGRSNVLWMLGGDRPAEIDASRAKRYGFPGPVDMRPIWRTMASSIKSTYGEPSFFLYHTAGGDNTTSKQLLKEDWLHVHSMQSGHGGGHDVPVWDWIAHDYALQPAKPTVDLEPNYEDHPFNSWPRWDPANGWFRDHEVRKQCYRSVLAGGCGVTYGHHAVWSFSCQRQEIINHADRDWITALRRPAAQHMQHLRRLIESRPYFSRIPDPSLVSTPSTDGFAHLCASRDQDGTWAMIYFPMNDQSASVDLTKLKPGSLKVWWYDPRTGFAHPKKDVEAKGTHTFTSPPNGPDWVLVLDAASSAYAAPGS